MSEGKRKRGRPVVTDDNRWSDREMMDFVAALQRYGSADTKNIALAVKTKSENAVKAFIWKEVSKTRTKLFRGRGVRRGNFQTCMPRWGQAEGWPAARKWQKIAQNQMMTCTRKVDYSCLLMPQIWERFRDEANPPSDPQAVDVRAIYAYVVDCVRGRAPPELPPKESAILLMLLRLMREMRQEMDTQEETRFIHNFRKATTFVPFKVKDEFKKTKGRQAAAKEEEAVGGGVPIPEEVWCGLSRHRKVVQSLNPLAVPLWLLEKEQEFLARMFDAPSP